MTFQEVYAEAQKRLTQAEILGAAGDLRRLFCKAIGSDDGIIRVDMRDEMPPEQQQELEGFVERRIQREPVSHLLKKREFYGRDFEVSKDALDPRQDTETLIDAALEEPFGQVLDLGTGTGCIVITLVLEARKRFEPTAWGLGVDLSKKALVLARRNRKRHFAKGPVVLQHSDWFSSIELDGEATFDLIVSNPPYIAADEMEGLQPEVRLYEPRMALTDEADGLSAYRKITSGAIKYLAPGGRLIVEIGPTQGQAVSQMMAEAGMSQIKVIPDLDGRDRVVTGHFVQTAGTTGP